MSEPETVQRTRDYPATPAEVWEAFADPEHLAEWWGGEIDLPLTEGAEGEVEVDGETAFVHVEEVEPGHRLVYRWATSAEPPSRVEVDFVEIDAGTRLIVVERPVPHGLAVCAAPSQMLALV